tara:strand:+ start:15337 stop:16263 length:927 start_codon:yes stop_codon:yes gene_type:complete
MMLTKHPRMKNLIEVAESVASSRAAILIQGENGAGKHSLAKFIHSKSQRARQKIVSVNCSSLPGGLLEAELFGHVKGAFVGANQDKAGKLELAHNSTLIIDDINEMSVPLQAKLLKAIQDSEVERIGSNEAIKINVRIIATASRSLERMVREGKFREDLYYRINVIPLEIPALRERVEDIEVLAKHFVEVSCILNNKPKMKIHPEALEKLSKWKWPGNVRELENTLERAVLLNSDVELTAAHLDIPNVEALEDDALEPGMTIGEAERRLILKTLEFTKQNRTKAAKLLGISIRTLRNKIHEYRGENYL